jgi:hypothetical protein
VGKLENFDLKKYHLEKKVRRTVIVVILLLFLLLFLAYYVIGIVYNSGNFSVTLDKNLYFDDGLIMYDDPTYKVYRSELLAPAPDTFDNISYKWLPKDLSDSEGGSHNGDNYLAYTFFIENQGIDVADYWYEVVIDDVIKNVDEAVRVRVYKDDEYVTYALAKKDGTPEKNTTPFLSDEIVAIDHVEEFMSLQKVFMEVVSDVRKENMFTFPVKNIAA